jgi:hypothetical protein
MADIKSMFKGVVGSTIEKEKENVLSNIKNTSGVLDDVKEKYKNLSLSDLGDVKLSTIASSLGVDTNKLGSINEITDGISLSGIDITNPAQIKKQLLDKITEKNLTKDLLNKDLLSNLGAKIGVNATEIENMIKSKDSVKILADIKDMTQFDKLDETVKQKIMENNFLPNMDILNDSIKTSVDLMSNSKSVRERATQMAQSNLKPQFEKMLGKFTKPESVVKIINTPTISSDSFQSSFQLSDGDIPDGGVKGGITKPELIVYLFEYDAFDLLKIQTGTLPNLRPDGPQGAAPPEHPPVRNPKIVVEKFTSNIQEPLPTTSGYFYSFDQISTNDRNFWENSFTKSTVNDMRQKAIERKKIIEEKGIEISKDGIVKYNGIPYSIYELKLPNGQTFVEFLKNNLGNNISFLPNKAGFNFQNLTNRDIKKEMSRKYDTVFRDFIQDLDNAASKSGRDPQQPIINYEIVTEPNPESTNTDESSNTKFIENFDKLDYRIQKVAAVSMGFTDDRGGVAKFKEVINKLKEYKKLDELSKSYTESLLSHVETLEMQQSKNSDTIKDYKEQHGITDDQYEYALEAAYSMKNSRDDVERFEYEEVGTKDLDDMLSEIDDEKTTENLSDNPFPDYLELDMNLFQKDAQGKLTPPYVYNGSITLTGKKDKDGNPLNSIPIKIHRVLGNFICKNMNLKSLENVPETINGNFDCSNNNLVDLVGGPSNVYGTYYAMNNQLESLKGMFTVNNVDVSNNKLKSLHSLPNTGQQPNLFINGNINLSNNLIDNMYSNMTVYGELNVSRNYLTDSSFIVTGNELPKLYSKASFVANNQINGKMLDEYNIRTKLQLNDTIKVIA